MSVWVNVSLSFRHGALVMQKLNMEVLGVGQGESGGPYSPADKQLGPDFSFGLGEEAHTGVESLKPGSGLQSNH